MRLFMRLAMVLSVMLAVAGCSGGDPQTPSASPTGPAIDSVSAFQQFSGLTIPASAKNIALRVTTGPTGRPAYLVRFSLPTADLDPFCLAGQLQRPLHITTIPVDVRKTFDYQGDSSTGVQLAEGSLPSNVDVQRQVLAVGTKKSVADVHVYSETFAR